MPKEAILYIFCIFYPYGYSSKTDVCIALKALAFVANTLVIYLYIYMEAKKKLLKEKTVKY